MIERKWHHVFLGLGSNVGEKKENIQKAINFLEERKEIILGKVSTLVQTEPWGNKKSGQLRERGGRDFYLFRASGTVADYSGSRKKH
jgi:hypothetical protein